MVCKTLIRESYKEKKKYVLSSSQVWSFNNNNNNTLYLETDIYNLNGTYLQIVKTSRGGRYD